MQGGANERELAGTSSGFAGGLVLGRTVLSEGAAPDVIGIMGVAVIAAVTVGVGVMLRSPSSPGITVGLHSFTTNFFGTNKAQVVAVVVVSNNTSSTDFAVSISAERMTNGTFPRAPLPNPPFEVWAGREHGLVFVEVVPGSKRCRLVAQYRRVPATRVGGMLEPLRTTLLGPRPIMHRYSEEFETPR